MLLPIYLSQMETKQMLPTQSMSISELTLEKSRTKMPCMSQLALVITAKPRKLKVSKPNSGSGKLLRRQLDRICTRCSLMSFAICTKASFLILRVAKTSITKLQTEWDTSPLPRETWVTQAVLNEDFLTYHTFNPNQLFKPLMLLI